MKIADIKIADIVRAHISGIIAYCENQDKGEFARLQDARYCKENMDINYPFFKQNTHITPDLHVRYWSSHFKVGGAVVRVSSQWFNPPTSKSAGLLRAYLQQRGIALQTDIAAPNAPHRAQSAGSLDAAQPARAPKGRYRGNPIGNAQNHLVRHILSRLGEDTFSADDWLGVVAQFGNACAYCGADGKLVMDHAVPINRESLGEHRLGNLVPACAPCNAAKGQSDYRSHLMGDKARIAAIGAHMARHGYTPIGANAKLQAVIEAAHAELRQMADRYVQLIETTLPRADL